MIFENKKATIWALCNGIYYKEYPDSSHHLDILRVQFLFKPNIYVRIIILNISFGIIIRTKKTINV